MADLVLTNFPPSLLVRLDRYIELLEELNPGYQWTRSAAVASLLALLALVTLVAKSIVKWKTQQQLLADERVAVKESV